ncbi:MAG: AbiH family protein [Bacilli bacterium]
MKLYIIGNGFDLAHGLHTSYSDYFSFVKKHASKYNGWDIILKYYPEEHEFWSDAETNICKINLSRFIDLKRNSKPCDLNILLDKIHESFEQFIINAEKDVEKLKRKFIIDTNSIFISFNYTSVLENVYQVPSNRVIHLHNFINNPAPNKFFALDHNDLVLGHGPDISRYFYYVLPLYVGSDKDYISFRQNTLKNSSKIIKDKNWSFFFL